MYKSFSLSLLSVTLLEVIKLLMVLLHEQHVCYIKSHFVSMINTIFANFVVKLLEPLTFLSFHFIVVIV